MQSSPPLKPPDEPALQPAVSTPAPGARTAPPASGRAPGPPTPGRRLALRLYYAACFAMLGVYLPFFPRWLEARGIHGLAMGAIAAAFPAMTLVAPPLFGLVADALGLRGSLLRLASGGAFLAFGSLALASLDGSPPGFAAILVTIAVFAFFRSPMVMIADVIALEQAPAEGTTYGRIRLWGSLGFLVAVLAAGRFIDPARPAVFPVAVAGALLLAFVMAFALPTRAAAPRGPVPEHVRALLGSADFRLFLFTSFLGQVAHSAYDLIFSLHLRDLGLGEGVVAMAWALGVLAEILVMALSAPVARRVAPPVLLAAALLVAAARWAAMGWLRTPAGVFLLQPLHGITFGLMWVASLAFVKERVEPHILASGQGVYLAVMGAASVTGMLFWGDIYPLSGGFTVFRGASLVAVVAAAFGALFAREAKAARSRRNQALPSPC